MNVKWYCRWLDRVSMMYDDGHWDDDVDDDDDDDDDGNVQIE